MAPAPAPAQTLALILALLPQQQQHHRVSGSRLVVVLVRVMLPSPALPSPVQFLSGHLEILHVLVSALRRLKAFAHHRVVLPETRCLSRGHSGTLPVRLVLLVLVYWFTTQRRRPETLSQTMFRRLRVYSLSWPAGAEDSNSSMDRFRSPSRLAWKLERDLELVRLTPRPHGPGALASALYSYNAGLSLPSVTPRS